MGFKLVRIDATEPCKIFIPLGSHFIGRGKLLDCNDHRVSRKHAELIVTEDSVLLKSLHQNPCFVKRKSSKETLIFCQPESQTLSNGDQFGLIPDSYWYEVISCLEDSPDIIENVKTILSKETKNEQTCKIEDESSKQKVAIDEDSNTEPFNDGNNQNIDESILDEKESQSVLPPENPLSPPIEAEDGPESPSSDFLEEDVDTQSTEKLMDSIDQIVESKGLGDESSDSPDALLMDLPDESPDQPDELLLDLPDEPIDQASKSPEQPTKSPDQSLESDQFETAKKRSHSRDSSPYDVKKVKTEPDYSTETKDEPDRAAMSYQVVKTEPSSPQDVKPGPSNDQQGPSNDGNNNPAAVQSLTKPPNNLRERCMYGPRCYRRNPEHKAKYSHPGDPDWGAGGAQAPCPWGAACRKTDPRHWRDHSHPPGLDPPPPRQPAGNRPGKRQRRKRSSTSESDASSDTTDLIVTGKRARKPIVRQGWSDSEENEDPFKTDESDEWEPSSDVTRRRSSQS